MGVCRLHAKRGWSWRYGLGQGGARGENPRGGGRAHPPITLHDLDVYFASLRRVDPPPPYNAAVANPPPQDQVIFGYILIIISFVN